MGGEVQLIFNISSWFASQNNSQNGGGSCSNIQSNLQRDREYGGSWLVLILSDFAAFYATFLSHARYFIIIHGILRIGSKDNVLGAGYLLNS